MFLFRSKSLLFSGAFPSFMSTSAAGRIVGGQDAESPIPWQVSVRNGQSGWGHFCGGTILDATTVMSAAHCFTSGQSMSGYYITAGVTNRKVSFDSCYFILPHSIPNYSLENVALTIIIHI